MRVRNGQPSEVEPTASRATGSGRPEPVPVRRPEGAARDVLRAAIAHLDEAEHAGCPRQLTLAQIRVAGCYRTIGALTVAEESLRQALRTARAGGSNELVVDVLCRLAETACAIAEQRRDTDAAAARAARDRARDEAFEASALVYRSIEAAWAVGALLRIGDVLNLCGDHEDAAALKERARQSKGHR